MELLSSKKRRRRLNSTNEKQKVVDFVTNKFSKELVLNVFSFLSLQDLIQCTAVSADWSSVANDEMLWKPLFFRRFRHSFQHEHLSSKFHNTSRRVSVSKYGGSWKMKYRVHHNWLLGKCYIDDIKAAFNCNNALSPHVHQLQFLNDVVFIAQCGGSTIDMWKYMENGSSLISQIPTGEDIDAIVTYLKLVQSTKTHLVAGYSDGGFTVWEVEGSSSYDISVKELASYIPRTAGTGSVVSISMNYPLVLVCTDKMKLSAFHINDVYSLTLVHRLQSPIDWSQIEIDIQRYFPQRNSKVHSLNTELWRVVVCFAVSGESSGPSIGIQELILSSSCIKSSRHCFASSCEPFFSSVNGDFSASPSERITAMTYSPPYLLTAHANNTIKHYIINIDEDALIIALEQTLYGHTFHVNSLAMDASRKKMISGDRSGIRIWDLSERAESQVILNNHLNQSEMKELPHFGFESIGFDEDKIIAIVKSMENSFVRVWSFNTQK